MCSKPPSFHILFRYFYLISFFSVASVGGLGFVNLVENECLVVCVGV